VDAVGFPASGRIGSIGFERFQLSLWRQAMTVFEEGAGVAFFAQSAAPVSLLRIGRFWNGF